MRLAHRPLSAIQSCLEIFALCQQVRQIGTWVFSHILISGNEQGITSHTCQLLNIPRDFYGQNSCRSQWEPMITGPRHKLALIRPHPDAENVKPMPDPAFFFI
jgi:hypothetical protein